MANLIEGNNSNNTLNGTNDADLMLGNGGFDILKGGAGNDTLDGGEGIDQLTGGAGYDQFRFSSLTDSVRTGGAMDRIADFTSGSDVIDLTGLNFFNITSGATVAGQLKLSYDPFYNQTYVFDYNSNFGFYLSGNHSTLSDQDFIYGNVIEGDAFDNKTLTGTDSGDVIYGYEGNDVIHAGKGFDKVYGGEGADWLYGENGNDTLDGGASFDQLHGGAGADVFKFSSLTDSVFNSALDRIADFEQGMDKIDVSGLGFTGATSGIPAIGQLKIIYDAYYNQTYVRDVQGSGFGFYLTGKYNLTAADFIFDNTVSGTALADKLSCGAASELVYGFAGNDTIKGGNGNDAIFGGNGADHLFGDAGNDTLDGGAGVDQLWGGAGNDVFKFSNLNDSVFNHAMDRIVDFVKGEDTIDLSGLNFTGVSANGAGAGELKVVFDAVNNQTYVYDVNGTGFGFYFAGDHSDITNADFNFGHDVEGTYLSETINGTGFNNILSGLEGHDTLRGAGGNDLLLGGDGADHLFGDAGNDTLVGGNGVDQLWGGAGNDVFKFTATTDSVFNSALDRVADFVKGEDMIDLSGLGFNGVSATGAGAGELKVSFDAFYNQTYVQDTHGSSFGFYLSGDHADLTNADFVF